MWGNILLHADNPTGIQHLARRAKSPHKPSTLLPSPRAVRQRQSPGDVSTIIYWKREHSRGDRPPLEPWQDKAAPQGAPGTGHPTAPHPSSSSSSPGRRSTPWGKPGGRLKACRNLHKAIPEVPEQQQGSRDALSSVCCTCCSKVEHSCCFHLSRSQALQRESCCQLSKPPSFVSP